MAATQQASSFNDIIQASRQKKKNEDLANKILGKNRRASAPGSGVGKTQNVAPGNLASRIGVTKRSSSANLGSKNTSRASSAAGRNTASSAKPARRRRPDENRLMSALDSANGQATVRDTSGGISIKGAGSGPFVVVGKNFAPGTTAADIQSALEPVSGQIISCWVTSQQPTVTAEITFAEKPAAEKAIANFHNQRADGRVLSMQFKTSTAGANTTRDVFDRPTPTGPRNASYPFNNQREQADRDRRAHRAADPMVQDGRFGFSEQNNQPINTNDTRNTGRGNSRRSQRGKKNFDRSGRSSNQGPQETSLYSDEMMTDAPLQNTRNKGSRQQ
ncbi:hypothetical protein BDW59DRAFT_45430 [Aspergillus cavernicola]|uniref:RRM domain-containing protein n=1 Tax=Aspergillus cavernicola TaxID=176166 RepID=A0ABR4J5F2_9EURO